MPYYKVKKDGLYPFVDIDFTTRLLYLMTDNVLIQKDKGNYILIGPEYKDNVLLTKNQVELIKNDVVSEYL